MGWLLSIYRELLWSVYFNMAMHLFLHRGPWSNIQCKRVNAFPGKEGSLTLACVCLCRCPNLEVASAEGRLQENWNFLEERVGLTKRKLPTAVARCPKLLTVSLCGRLEPMILCLEGVGARRKDLIAMVNSFPHVLLHSVEEKLCPLLALLEALGVKSESLAKVCPSVPYINSLTANRP